MAKNKISEWDATASGNTDVGGININEGCPPSTINNAIREVMAQIKDQQTGADGDDLTITGTLTSSNALAVTGNFTVDGQSGTLGQVLVSAGTGNTPTWGNAFVAGMIMLWSGATDAVPAGWLLCDGTSSTPDLRDRFVVGAGSTYNVDATGGSTDAIVVSHTHTASANSVAAHTHTYTSPTSPPTGSGTSGVGGGSAQNFPATNGATTTSGGAHGHTVTVASAGVSGSNANLPPYYALAYIMKA